MFLMYLLTAGYCVYAESNKLASKEQPKYELKSDIINFDYSQLAYPSSKLEVGIKTDTARVPKKIVPGKPADNQITLNDILDGLLIVLNIFLGVTALYAFFVFLPCYIVKTAALIWRIIRKFREKNKN